MPADPAADDWSDNRADTGAGQETTRGNGGRGKGRSKTVSRTHRKGDNPPTPAARQEAIARRRYRAEAAIAAALPVPAAEEGTLLTAAQMREARRLIRERQATAKKEREFGERLVSTLTEGQNALNIAFGAILSAYVGTVLAAIDDKPFDVLTLASFFGLLGVFIGGLCIGNLVVLRRHFGLGLSFLVAGAIAAWLSLRSAAALGFELPILKVMYVCWYAMLVATDGLLTAIVFFHHRSVVRARGDA